MKSRPPPPLLCATGSLGVPTEEGLYGFSGHSLHGLTQWQKQKGTRTAPVPPPVPSLFPQLRARVSHKPLCLEGPAQHCCETPPQELSYPWEVLVKAHLSVLGYALRGECHFQLFLLCTLFLALKLRMSVALFPAVLIEMCSQNCSQPALYAGFGPPQHKSVGCVHMFCFSFFGESGGEGLSSPRSASHSWRSKTPLRAATVASSAVTKFCHSSASNDRSCSEG